MADQGPVTIYSHSDHFKLKTKFVKKLSLQALRNEPQAGGGKNEAKTAEILSATQPDNATYLR